MASADVQPVARDPVAASVSAPHRPASLSNAMVTQEPFGMPLSARAEADTTVETNSTIQKTLITQATQPAPLPRPAPAPPKTQPCSTAPSCCPNPYAHLTPQESEARRTVLTEQLQEIPAQIRLLDSAAVGAGAGGGGGARVNEFARTLAEHRQELDAGLRKDSPYFPFAVLSRYTGCRKEGASARSKSAPELGMGGSSIAVPVTTSQSTVPPLFKTTPTSHQSPYRTKFTGIPASQPVQQADPFLATAGEGLSQEQKDSLARQKQQFLDLMQARSAATL